MLSKVNTIVLNGLEGTSVEVETDISKGIPVFNIVGLADVAIRESKERVRAAISNSQLEFPISRITTNLVPANMKKEGSHLDLPIAIGILKSINAIERDLKDFAFIGELSLDGNINRVEGALPAVLHLKQSGIKTAVVPLENREEVGIIKGIDIIALESLSSVVKFLNKDYKVDPYTCEMELSSLKFDSDFDDIKGQSIAKRAAEIAAAGFHNLLLLGPKGAGKTMIAKRLPSIMPSLTFEESLEVTEIYSVAGLLKNKNIIDKRPFRSPHHTVSPKALSGGGRNPKPGEVSLAHRGVLFLDELPEFHKAAIECLRQPLEDREISISRVNGKVTYPSDIMLIAAMNPCPCGNYGTDADCSCSQHSIERYLSKISGPILDRIDMHIEVERIKYEDLESQITGENSKAIRERVESARKIQKERFKSEKIMFNSEINEKCLKRYCKMTSESNDLLREAFETLSLSARAYGKIIKVSRTIADLSMKDHIEAEHIAEAIQYRSLDRKYL